MRGRVTYDFARLAAVMGLTEPQAARALGLRGKTEQQYRRDGMSELVADRLAVKAGFVPWTIWPEWLEEAKRTCEARGCELRFVPARSTQRFCSGACRDREGVRRRYHANPEPKKASRRAYYQEAADYERSQAKRRYHYNVEASRAKKNAQRAAQRLATRCDNADRGSMVA